MQKLRGRGSQLESDPAVLVPALRTAHSRAAIENGSVAPDDHLEHLERLEQRVDELSRVSAETDEAREVLSDLSSRAADKQEVTSLRGEVECLSNAHAEVVELLRSNDAELRGTISSVSSAVEELRELARQERDELGGHVARDEALDALRARLDELAATQADLAAERRDLHPAAVDYLRTRLDDLARELGADLDSRTARLPTRAEIEEHVDQATLDRMRVDVDKRINALQVCLDELSAAQADIERTSAVRTNAELDAIRARLHETGRRVEHGDEAWARAEERVTALEVAHEQAVRDNSERTDNVAGRIRQVADEAVSVSEVATLRNDLAMLAESHETLGPRIAEIDARFLSNIHEHERRLEELAARLDARSSGPAPGGVPTAHSVDMHADDENDEPCACNASHKTKKRKRNKNRKKNRS